VVFIMKMSSKVNGSKVEAQIEAYAVYKKSNDEARRCKALNEAMHTREALKGLSNGDGVKAQSNSTKRTLSVNLQVNKAVHITREKRSMEASPVATFTETYEAPHKLNSYNLPLDRINHDNIAIQVEYKAPTTSDNKGKKTAWVLTDDLKRTAVFDDAEACLENNDIDGYLSAIHEVLTYSISKYLMRKGFFTATSKEIIPNTADHDDYKSLCYLASWEVLNEWKLDGIKDKPLCTYDSKDVYNLLKGYTGNKVMDALRKIYTMYRYDNIQVNDIALNEYKYIGGAVFNNHINGIQNLYDTMAVDDTIKSINKALTKKEAEYLGIIAHYGSKAVAQGKTSDGVKVKRIKSNKVNDLKHLCHTMASGYKLTDAQIIDLAHRHSDHFTTKQIIKA